MVDFETSFLSLRSRNQIRGKLPLSRSKTTSLQREPFLTMFYTINSSPLLVTTRGFMLINILSNYQKYPLPLSVNNSWVSHHNYYFGYGHIFSDNRYLPMYDPTSNRPARKLSRHLFYENEVLKHNLSSINRQYAFAHNVLHQQRPSNKVYTPLNCDTTVWDIMT